MEGAVVPQAIGMAEDPPPYVRNSLHVGVRGDRPDCAWRKPIVIEEPQRPDPHLPGIAIAIKREVPAGLEPAALFVVDLAVPAYVEHGSPLQGYRPGVADGRRPPANSTRARGRPPAREPRRQLGNLDRALGEARPVAVDDTRQGRSVAGTGAESDEQGRQVLGSGMRVADRRGAVDKVGQLVDIAVFEGFVLPGVEFGRPRRRRRVQAEVAEKRQTV